jgi:hypothetical protein
MADPINPALIKPVIYCSCTAVVILSMIAGLHADSVLASLFFTGVALGAGWVILRTWQGKWLRRCPHCFSRIVTQTSGTDRYDVCSGCGWRPDREQGGKG